MTKVMSKKCELSRMATHGCLFCQISRIYKCQILIGRRGKAMTNYPIGARWEVVTDIGEHGTIWLDNRLENLEIWRWSTEFTHGNGRETDWTQSYRACREEIPLWNKSSKPIRFRRVKP